MALMVLLVALAVWWFLPTKASAPRYRTAEVEVGDVARKVSATGTLQAVTRIDVGSEVSGRIASLEVGFNSTVKRGDVLARLDPATFQAQLEQAQASVNNATSGLNSAVADAGNAAANVRTAEAAIKTAQSKILQAQANVANARASVHSAEAAVAKAKADWVVASRNSERMTELAGRDLVALSEAEQAVATGQGSQAGVETAQAQLEGAQANLLSNQTNVDAARVDLESAQIKRDAALELQQASQARIQGARAQVQQAQANLDQARINLERTVIRSPIDGIVLDVLVTEGQTVAAQLQAPSLFILAENLNQMQVETSIDEADIGQVKAGMKAIFTVDAFPDERFEGKVTEVRQSPVVVQNVVTYTVIIEATNPELRLKPGMTATVDIVVESKNQVTMIPSAALRFKPDETESGSGTQASGEQPRLSQRRGRGEGRSREGRTVYTLEGDQLVPHKVKTGLTDAINTEMIEGDLKSGQQVVVGKAVPETEATPASSNNRSGGNRRRGMRMF